MRIALLFIALASGCSPGSGSSGAPADAQPPDEASSVSCAADPRLDAYVPGLKKSSTQGGLTVTLVAIEPNPPSRGTNSWTVRVEGAGGQVLPGAPDVLPFMPDHGHGSSIKAVATPQADGSYLVSPLYLFMPGVWRVTFSLPSTDAGAAGDEVAFHFCVAG